MAKPQKLGPYLEWNNGTIRVTVPVPRKLHDRLPTRLKQSLKTDSPANAERIKHRVIQELKDKIAQADRQAGNEALGWRADIERARASGAVEQIEGAEINRDAESLEFLLQDRAEEIEKAHGPEAAGEFYAVASGQATPLDAMMDTYLGESGLRERSFDELRRALRVYAEWCASEKVPQTLEGTTRRIAGRFVSERLLATMQRKTAEKYLSFLSGYWKWLETKGHVREIPWTGQLTRVGKGRSRRAAADGLGETGGTGKRPYTAEEAARLLYTRPTADTAQRTADLTWIGALSGMRLDEIARLRVADCAGGWFNVNAWEQGKSEASPRRVPIHSALVPIIARRCEGKAPTAYLIEDLPSPPPGSNRERSMPASKAYTRFRRELGLEEKADGQRQSNIDFHSWRRWFIREAREAGATLWTLADLVGHDTKSLPGGLTMSRYPGPSSDALLQACVESVRPPEAP